MEKRPIVEVSEEQHKALKMYAAEHGTHIKAIVAEAIKAHLKKLGKPL